MSSDPDEDLIEATIRRVAASKAARLPEIDDGADSPGGDTSAGGLHLVAAAEEATAVAAPATRPAADEGLIEATLRRIEAEQAARASEQDAEDPPLAEAASERSSPPDIHLVREEEDETGSQSPFAAERVDADHSAQAAQSWDAGSGPGDNTEIAGLRRDLEDTRRQLRELSARVDALAGSPRDQLRPARSPAPPRFSGASAPARADEDWDEAPVIPRIDTGLPPRPPIIRDPSPPVAIAGLSDAAAIEEPAGNPKKKGFDLLPRTYRITVEDKRRGVDLVPLHRALLGMDGVRDMSLLSYSNGTAIVALEATSELSPDVLGAAVSHAMARQVKVEVHNEQTMVVKLAED